MVRGDRRFRIEALASLAVLALVLAGFARFVHWVEARPGAVLADPVLARIEPRQLDLPTFALIYGGILFALARLAMRPRRLVGTLQAYTLLVALRALAMAVTPLDPPLGLLPLHDPIVNGAVGAQDLQRDLFFSGHTSLLVLLACCVPGRRARWLLALAAAAVAALLVAQHVHYSADVLVAPLAAWTAYSIVFLTPRRNSLRARDFPAART